MKIKDEIMNSYAIKKILSQFSEDEMADALIIIENIAKEYQSNLDKIDISFMNKENIEKVLDVIDEAAKEEIFGDE